MKKLLLFCLPAILALFLNSCKKDPVVQDPPVVIPAETVAVDKWIHDNMEQLYLWNDKMPTDAQLDYSKESDPEKYFYKLLYHLVDKWSYITNDYAALNADLIGEPVDMGYAPGFFLVGTNHIVIVVNFVYPGSAAADAGLKRGDIILTIDNHTLDTTNYYQSYSAKTYSVQLGALNGNTLVSTGVSYNLTARKTEADPSIHHQVLDMGGHKIGYLVYVGFTSGVNDAYIATMDAIFAGFKTAGITDLIVDLRYNPGGDIDAAVHLASNIVPAAAAADKIFMNFNYNQELQQYLVSNRFNDNLYRKFTSNAANLSMPKVYFLTTSRSASASELVIIGLKPYMSVVQIGDYTYGKFTASTVIPDDNEKWAMMPIIAKYSNAAGYTDFINGLTPDYRVDDNAFAGVPFGNTGDPVFAKAVSLITGQAIPGRKSALDRSLYRSIIPHEMETRSNLYIFPRGKNDNSMRLNFPMNGK